ncbi:MAG: multidrug efflux SMR transporter [Nitrospinae bacterium]|nr:multidrug efflux SMR transporter [Nitrospinota bacterium]
MAWLYLALAGVVEIGWAVSLKYTEGFTRLWPSAGSLALAVVSVYLLSVAIRTIPIGTGYAVWTGIGAAGTAIIGVMYFEEPRDAGRLLCIGIIIAGIAGLKFYSR